MATEEILMPQLGESVTEGTSSQWLVSAGDQVHKYDPIAEVMTDKVNAEVPISFTGKIKELTASEGETIAVGERIGYIEVEGASDSAEDAAASKSASTAETSTEHSTETSQETSDVKQRYSPAVLNLAQQHNIDLNTVEGSGRGGRITRKDVQAVIDAGGSVGQTTSSAASQVSSASSTTSSERSAAAATNAQAAGGDVEIPISGVRKAIADNMLQSKHEAPHAWTMVEVDVTDLVNFRQSIKDDFKQSEGHSLTFMPFFIKAVVEALKEFPQMNAMWGGDKIIQKKDINISIAVATDDALFVPVIKQADEQSIKGLARSVQTLSGKVRQNQLSQDDMTGGTFTVNNTGSFGSVMSAPIINQPQAAILSVESIVKRPVVIDHMIAIRDMVNLCLSLDHRVLDGLICGRFLARVKEKLENMNKETLSIY